eukprot:2803452-Pyramimonas_sp.AAC.1
MAAVFARAGCGARALRCRKFKLRGQRAWPSNRGREALMNLLAAAVLDRLATTAARPVPDGPHVFKRRIARSP